MDQIKIGAFIAALRKEQGLTQRQLAEELGISDKTVSKWETGKGLPEVSLMLPLCQCLGISVNELLSGERLEQENYEQKAEENMLNCMSAKEQREKRDKKFIRIFNFVLSLYLGHWLISKVIEAHIVPHEVWCWLCIILGFLGLGYLLYENHKETIGPIEFAVTFICLLLWLSVYALLLLLLSAT